MGMSQVSRWPGGIWRHFIIFMEKTYVYILSMVCILRTYLKASEPVPCCLMVRAVRLRSVTSIIVILKFNAYAFQFHCLDLVFQPSGYSWTPTQWVFWITGKNVQNHMTHPVWDLQLNMETRAEHQRKEKGANRTALSSQGGTNMIFKLSIKDQGPNKRFLKPLLKVRYVISTKDQYIERAARVITFDVLKLSLCSIVRGSTDISRLQAEKVLYQYSLHNSHRNHGWLKQRKRANNTMHNVVHVHCICNTSSQMQDRLNVKDIRRTDGSHSNARGQNAYNYDFCWLQLRFKFLSNCINELLSVQIVLPWDSVIQHRPCQPPRRA